LDNQLENEEQKKINVDTGAELIWTEQIFIKLKSSGQVSLCTPVDIHLTCGPISLVLDEVEEPVKLEGT